MIRGAWTIRMRLTLWNATVLMLILGAVCLGIYVFVEARLTALDRTRLADEYRMVASLIRNSGGDVYDLAHIRDSVSFRVVFPDGGVYTSRPWERTGLPPSTPAETQPPEQRWHSPDGRIFRLRSGEVAEVGWRFRVAHDMTGTVESVRTLRRILAGALPLSFLLALAGGWFLATRALAPVEAMTRKAREITAESLSDRLPVARPDDELGRLATVINETFSRLESAFAHLQQFTADASHELRTPLTAIRSVGEVALRDLRNTNGHREAIGSMLEEADRLSRLVDDLLYLARGDSPREGSGAERFDLAALVAGVAGELRVLAEEKEQRWNVTTGPALTIRGEPSGVRRALINVLDNAIRHAPRGGQVDPSVARENHREVVIEVLDDGPGIPPAERERVFERFRRLDEGRSRAVGGSGLGLALARQALSAAGGRIEFADPHEGGARCRITLPLDLPDESRGQGES